MKSFVFVFLFLLGTLAWADVAPTEWYGGSIKPFEGSVVTMESVSVEIRWGTPCSLRAVFVMNNPSDSPQEVLVGFPMPSLVAYRLGVTPDPLTMSFNGVSVKTTAPIASAANPDDDEEWIWHSCKHSFAPGKTVVEVNTVLHVSLVKGKIYQECMRYCIESGGKWAGEIGAEDVLIVFPSAIKEGQIIEAKPAGAKIEGSRVSWSFKNFKPKGNEFDVELTYVRPDVMDKIAQLRNELRQQPQSAAAAIKLAKHLMALGNSNSGYAKEGEALLLGLLEKDRHNAEAWNVYLASPMRFAFEAYGDQRAVNMMIERQAALIKEAAKNCPKDECIELWGKEIKRVAQQGSDGRQRLKEIIEKKGYRATEFPSIDYNYY